MNEQPACTDQRGQCYDIESQEEIKTTKSASSYSTDTNSGNTEELELIFQAVDWFNDVCTKGITVSLK